MSQKTALIASILKPVDDTRLYEKLGKTIGQTTKYRVNIIGFVTKKLPQDSSTAIFIQCSPFPGSPGRVYGHLGASCKNVFRSNHNYSLFPVRSCCCRRYCTKNGLVSLCGTIFKKTTAIIFNTNRCTPLG